MSKLYFPILIESTKKSIKLSDSAHFIRVDNPRVRNLIGIQHVVLSDSGHIREIGYRDDAPWYIWATYLLQGGNSPYNIRQNNFVLSVATRQEAVLVAFAMKLIAGTLSGPYVGFSDIKNPPFSIQFLNLSPYWGGDILVLGRKEISMLRTLLVALSSPSPGAKLETIIEKYRYAESKTVPSRSLRFLELAVILEMLFLPTADKELSYRFQLRIAKWFKRHHREDILDVAAKAKRIYKLRSDIAHSGTAKISDEDMSTVRDLTRMALRKFVLDRSIFTDTYLDELCLLG